MEGNKNKGGGPVRKLLQKPGHKIRLAWIRGECISGEENEGFERHRVPLL